LTGLVAAHVVPLQESAVPLPTAMQWVVDTHETLLRLLPMEVLGVAWMLQVPDRTSASELLPALSWLKPTASQWVALVQETPASWVLFVPGGSAVVWIDQVVPFQDSASAKVPALVVYEPTATHPVPAHDTPVNWLEDAPAGALVGSAVQFDPFQSWLTGVPGPKAVVSPTAMHELATQDTALSTVVVAPGGFAGSDSVQAEPFDVSASWNVSLLLLLYDPTARQAVGDMQDTPVNVAFTPELSTVCCVQPAQAGWLAVSAIAVAVATTAKWRQVTAARRPLTSLVIIVTAPLSSVPDCPVVRTVKGSQEGWPE
jgi:hypothetical protein